MYKVEIHIQRIEYLQSAAKLFLDQFGHNKIFAFEAEMGSGKTTFITTILHAMGIIETEGSPTYSLVNVYESPMFGRVFHFDVYRLRSEEEAMDIGIEEILYGGGMCFIEWPEKIQNLLPENTIWVYIRKSEDNSRTITIDQ